MPRFEDVNGVTWDIKTTSVTVDPGTSTGKFVATVAEDSVKDYSNHTFNHDAQTGQGNHIVWPANGNPMLDGPGAENAAQVAIKAFANSDVNKKQLGTRQGKAQAPTGPTDAGSLFPILLLAAAIFYFEGKR